MAMQDFSRSLPMMLYRTLDAVMPRFRQIFNEFGLTEQQWRVLRVLWEQGPTTSRELARLTLIPAPSLVGIVDRLIVNGLVSRVRSNEDRRNVFIDTTAAGNALEAKVRPRVDKAYDELRASIQSTDWNELISGLERLSSIERDTRNVKTTEKQ
jgi:homoprotocatechuate degradation regulator HpaR